MNANLLSRGAGRSRSGLPPPTVLRAGLLVLLAIVSLLMIACGAGGGGGGGGGGAAAPPSPNPSTIAKAEVVPPGSTCPAGGETIYYGIDDNGNGVLDEAERDGSITICNVGLVSVTDEAPGANCLNGGLRVDVGVDNGANGGTAGDGVLQSGESTGHYFICNVGEGEGTVSALAIDTGLRHHGSVAAGGSSYYQFTTPDDETPRVWIPQLTRTDSDLGWALYQGGTATLVAACNNYAGQDADELCITPYLSTNTAYTLKVQEHSGLPNLFDVDVEDTVMIAADRFGRIFRVDPRDGALTLAAETSLDSVPFMAYPRNPDAATPTAYTTLRAGYVYVEEPEATWFYGIDPFAGTSTLIQLSDAWSNFANMTPDPNNGLVYVAVAGNCDSFVALDPAGGTTWSEGRPADNDGGWCQADTWALVADGGGYLWAAGSKGDEANFWFLDLGNRGAGWSVIGEEGGTTYHGFGSNHPRYVRAMAFQPHDGEVFGIAVDDVTSTPTAYLVWINPSTAEVWYVAPLPESLTSLAFVSTYPYYNP